MGYERRQTHWRYGRKSNLCAYLATLLARGEISEAEAEQPTAAVAQRAVEERQRVFALLRGEEAGVAPAFVAYFLVRQRPALDPALARRPLHLLPQ